MQHSEEAKSNTTPVQHTKEPDVVTERVSISTADAVKMEDEPEEWIRNNIVMKAKFLTRVGMGNNIPFSMSKDDLKKMSQIHEKERKQLEKEEGISEQDLEVERSYSNAEGDFSLNFFKRTDDEIRQSYINKLINMKILKTEPAKKHQSMIIYDWDDTLFCTTFLGQLGFVDIPPEILATLKPLDEAASRTLLKSLEYGQLFIITNSTEGWVQYSSKLFLQKTHQVIMDKKIEVISARSGYEDLFPGDYHRWKTEAFLGIKKHFDKNIITNLICLGDSHIEIDAAHVLAQQFSQAMIKTIKFRENPRPDELVKQLDLVYDKFEQIYMSIRNLTIRLEKRSSGAGLI